MFRLNRLGAGDGDGDGDGGGPSRAGAGGPADAHVGRDGRGGCDRLCGSGGEIGAGGVAEAAGARRRSWRGWAGGGAGASGFTLIEFIVVVAIVGVLLLVLFPRFMAFVSDARQSQARQEAMLVGAAIELMKVEGQFDAGDSGLEDKIRARVGGELEGWLASIDGDGSFVYSREAGGAVYSVSYNSLDGEYHDDVAQDVVSDE